jgi:hypothetical protein
MIVSSVVLNCSEVSHERAARGTVKTARKDQKTCKDFAKLPVIRYGFWQDLAHESTGVARCRLMLLAAVSPFAGMQATPVMASRTKARAAEIDTNW